MIKRIKIMAIGLITLFIVCGCNNHKENKIIDTNEIKSLCVYDAYSYEKEDGNTYKYLNGNTQVVNIEVNEKRSDSHIKYNCDKKKDEVYESFGVNATCRTDSKTATNGNKLYSYNLTYNYETKDNINRVISSLEEQKYKCFTYYNKDNSVVKENIIGSWCGFDPIVKVDEKIIFNEDGTGKYYVGKYTEYDFYYSIDDKNIIHYNNGGDILDLAFNEEKNIIFDGMYLDSTTNEIIQDEKVNYTYSKCQ